MPKGISIHIGLNRVNPVYYDDWFGSLSTCEADAEEMSKIASKMNFRVRPLILTDDATIDRVKDEITLAAKNLVPGDILLITYSGHGMQIPDKNNDELAAGETDGLDEAWVLFDGGLVDDELYSLWQLFDNDVRIIVISDSCHSGTIQRDMFSASEVNRNETGLNPPVSFSPTVRGMPEDVARKVYERDWRFYDSVQVKFPAGESVALRAQVLLISACQNDQLAIEEDLFGLFTKCLLQVWNDGAFDGNYKQFHHEISETMAKFVSPITQTPNYRPEGVKGDFGVTDPPFSIRR